MSHRLRVGAESNETAPSVIPGLSLCPTHFSLSFAWVPFQVGLTSDKCVGLHLAQHVNHVGNVVALPHAYDMKAQAN